MWKRLSMLWVVVKGDARLLWRALRHPQAPGWLKLGAAAIALYLVSPIDFIPDVVPFLGVVDDLVIVPLAIRWLYKQLPEWLRAEVEGRASATDARPAGTSRRPADGEVIDLPR
jgi:uncharacterized membrane protein YkvA (DUF1232 family)